MSVSEQPLHKRFERQIERIHQLLEAEDSKVTWDDRISDPDNPSRSRQIDITIRRDNCLTIVECRIHKKPQNVMWIDALIGRRQSLEADAVIAVSASGFTAGARAKAKSRGIILRDLATLSREEIQAWGRSTRLVVVFCELAGVTVTLTCPRAALQNPPILTNSGGEPLSDTTFRVLFQEIVKKLDDGKWGGQAATVEMLFDAQMRVNGQPPNRMKMTAKARRIPREVALASVVVYADPNDNIAHAEVGHFDLGSSEIIEHTNELSVIVDLSRIEIPKNCVFETIMLDLGKVVTMKRISFVGERDVLGCNIPIQFRFEIA